MIFFGRNGYHFCLKATVDSNFIFERESLYFAGDCTEKVQDLPAGQFESQLPAESAKGGIKAYCFHDISRWKVFHFHDTSATAGVKRPGSLIDNDYLRPDASNLAAFLFRLHSSYRPVYEQIRKTIQLAIPFFDDFVLRPESIPNGEVQISLYWRQKDSDYPLWPSQLSDGSLRFICLVTALLQPEPPSTIIIDEPELGLHPYALNLLGALLRSASQRMQVIVSTQSVPLVNQFSIEDLIVVEREEGASVFKRHNEIDYQQWLEDYTVGELWEKNVLGGRPPR
jgi:predicted ATPase